MRTARKSFALFGFLSLPLLLAPDPARANVIYTYTGISGSGFSASFETTRSVPQLLNLATGTDISADVVAFSITAPMPPSDQGGFGLDVAFVEPPFSVKIGTDGLGALTSWNVSETFHASYPVFPGEDPNDFFCRYSVHITNTGDGGTLTEDHDAGLCFGTSPGADPGRWTSTISEVAVPEPATLALLGTGILGLGLARRRKHA